MAGTDPAAAYGVLYPQNRTAISYLGPAFFSKFLYVAGGGERKASLILDSRVARSLRRSGWEDIRTGGGWSAETYSRYIALVHRWSEILTDRSGRPARPDLVELQLFKGPSPS